MGRSEEPPPGAVLLSHSTRLGVLEEDTERRWLQFERHWRRARVQLDCARGPRPFDGSSRSTIDSSSAGFDTHGVSACARAWRRAGQWWLPGSTTPCAHHLPVRFTAVTCCTPDAPCASLRADSPPGAAEHSSCHKHCVSLTRGTPPALPTPRVLHAPVPADVSRRRCLRWPGARARAHRRHRVR